MPDIGDLFPHHNNIPPALKGLSRENARQRLPKVACPLCGNTGQFFLFDKHYRVNDEDLSNFHVGVLCLHCGREHPFRRYNIMWLPRERQP